MEDLIKEKKLKIYKYGDDVLKLKAGKVENIDGKIIDLINRMAFTMNSTYTAVGLAAPQVGESLRLAVIDLSMGEEDDQLVVLINPEILEADGKDSLDEGCLSFPGVTMPVTRNTRILLKNIDLDGNEVRQEVDGFLARVIQHEMDHLDGTLIIDHVSSLKRQFVKKEIKRLQKEGEW